MKNSFTSAQRAPVSGSKKIRFAEQLKALTLFEILSCFKSGELSCAAIFGTVNTVGLAF